MSTSPRLSDIASCNVDLLRTPQAANATIASDNSVIELLGGITDLQYNFKPIMPDLYMPFREIESLPEINPACDIAMRKQKRLHRK